MTADEAKEKLVAWANAQIGTREGADNWNKYAEDKDLKKLYGWNVQNQPWCDVFVDAGFIELFGYELGSAMTYQYAGCSGAACAQSAAYYKAHGAFFSEPQLGDQIFFMVGNGINHTGIVTNVGDGVITTVEGNSSDMVARRSYTVGSPQIAGYGRPNWKLVEGKDIEPEPMPIPPAEPDEEKDQKVTVITLRLKELKTGDNGKQVQLAQIMLEANGCTCGWYGCDGDFGPATAQAVKNYQRTNGLTVDGIIGTQTWESLFRFMER